MSARELVRTFEHWRRTGEPMVLATVYETMGSTYSKAGHRILIAANGDYRGLVSGGCLEGDLAERARGVIETHQPTAVSFDMRDEADDLWGLGVGCNGLIRVFLQPLTEAGDYQPFSAIARSLLEDTPAVVATVIAVAGQGRLPPGATLVWNGGPEGAESLGVLAPGCREARAAGIAIYRTEANGTAVLYAPLKPIRRLLVLGAGPDAVPPKRSRRSPAGRTPDTSMQTGVGRPSTCALTTAPSAATQPSRLSSTTCTSPRGPVQEGRTASKSGWPGEHATSTGGA